MRIAFIIGLGAGLVSALLFASATTGTLLGLFVLFLLSPLPVAIAGLGWSWRSAAVAAVTGAALVAAVGGPRTAAFYFLVLGLPTALLCYLALLNRQTTDDQRGRDSVIEWYPIGRVVAVAAVCAGTLATLALVTAASDMDELRAALRATFERVFVQQLPASDPTAPKLGEREIAAFTELMVVSFAGIIATTWMLIATVNLWLAALVIRQSGRLLRPWPDLSALALPRTTSVAFAAAIALTFLPGYPGLIASGFAAALLFSFMLVGLAIVHHVSRGSTVRPLILGGVYAALAFLNPLSGLALALVGIAEPFSPLQRRWPSPPSPPIR